MRTSTSTADPPRIGLLHTYGLSGSGSCFYVRLLAATLAQTHEVHLISSERRPGDYDWIRNAYHYDLDGNRHTVFEAAAPGRGTAHTLDQEVIPIAYPRFEMRGRPVKALVEFGEEETAGYLERNTRVVTRIVSEQAINVLHVQHTLLMPLVALRISMDRGVPYVITVHGTMLEYVMKKHPGLCELGIAGFRGASRIIVLNEDVKRRVLEIDPTLEDRLVMVPIGIRIDRFDPVPRVRRAEVARSVLSRMGTTDGLSSQGRATLHELAGREVGGTELSDVMDRVRDSYDPTCMDTDLPRCLARMDWDQDVIVVFVGKHLVDKGIHHIFAATCLALPRAPRLRLLVMGNGVFREGLEVILAALDQRRLDWLAEMLPALAQRDPSGVGLHHLRELLDDPPSGWPEPGTLSDRVIFTGYLTRRWLGHLLPLADVSQVPSLIPEAFPLVLVEAMAAGVLPAGSVLGGTGQFLRQLELEFPEFADHLRHDPSTPGSVEHLAQNLVSLTDALGGNPHDVERRRALNDLARTRYSVERMTHRLLDVYRTVLGPAPG